MKIIKIILIVTVVMILNFALLFNTVQALEQQQITIYTTGNLSRMLKYDGMLIKTAHAVYEENGKQYPAYCLNKDLQGVGENIGSYQLTNEEKITDVGLWRVIINGYPYKSLEELGVANEEEAYIATKQSIYCYIYNRGTEKYSGIGDSGARTVNAMNIILENAKKSTENMGEQNIQITQSDEWRKENDYITKEYQITSDTNISKYSIKLENEPEGCKIVDLQNQEKSEFNSDEKFKISIPIKSLQESGVFKIKIETQMETKPIFYGKAPSSNLQDYALTAYSYETVNTEIVQNYGKNETELTIEKQDDKTNKKLKGATFEILDENKNVVKTGETDENGQIILGEILPGTYYIREIKAPEGYQVNDEVQKIDIDFNEKLTITIGNSQIIIKEEPKIENEIPKLPVTGM